MLRLMKVDLQYLAVIMIDHVYFILDLQETMQKGSGLASSPTITRHVCHMQHRGTEGQRESHILAVYI